jgi:hypothetical protein
MMLDEANLQLKFFMVKSFYFSQPSLNPLILVLQDLYSAKPY